jgi:hypothetical protein
MLAYVFWHWPKPELKPALYEPALKLYHARLGDAGAEGFQGSFVFKIEGAPWLRDGRGYEDWYLVEASFALDTLNEVAVSGSLRKPHDEVARGVAGMAAGLYRLRAGDQKLREAVTAVWLSKGGASYPEFDAAMAEWTGRPGVSLWRRQMVLGPTPEFCLCGPDGLAPPARYSPIAVRRQVVWPEPAAEQS